MTDSPDSVANMEKAFGTIWVGLSLMKDYFNCRLVYFLLIKSVLSTLILLPIIVHCDDLGSSWILLHFKRFRVWAPHPWNLTELPQAYVREMGACPGDSSWRWTNRRCACFNWKWAQRVTEVLSLFWQEIPGEKDVSAKIKGVFTDSRLSNICWSSWTESTGNT